MDNIEEKKQPQDEIGYIKPRSIEQEMESSYLDYAMSVIVARALPDARDGFKPVHRRIVYAMGEMGLLHNRKYTKCAKIVGEVLGKYHPHGDIAVYDSLVRMAQDFAIRYKLVDGQGNFGSMDGDSAAAMRYTEARMSKHSEEMLLDIDKETVDFTENYDASLKEPNVLPSRIPQLLLNGSVGIAVGMATNIPTHNLSEVTNAVVKIIDNPDASIDELMECLPGPDFPTGGRIYGTEGIKSAYSTGKGKIVIRGDAVIEENGKSQRIIITSLPYQVNKADLITKIAELVKLKKIEGISGLRDESDRTEGVRINIDLKSNSYPKKVLNQLFDYTSLQTAFHANFLALVNGIEPKILTLPQLLTEFVKHRQVVIRRRTEYLLKKAEERAHILEGLKIALDNIDAVVRAIKQSPDKEKAQLALMEKFKLSELQANAILEMRLSQLAALERQKIDDELELKKKEISEFKEILSDEKRILQIVKEETMQAQKDLGDKRRTKIIAHEIGNFQAEDLIPNESVLVTLTKDNYIKRIPVSAYKNQGRGGIGVQGITMKETDAIDFIAQASTHDNVMFFTDRGRVFTTKVYEIPSGSRQAKGQAIVNVLQINPEEKVTAMVVTDKEFIKQSKYFFMATEKGVVKKTEIAKYQNIRKTGIRAISLKDDDKLRFVSTSSEDKKIILVSQKGQGIVFEESQVRPMGRSASGVRGMKLRTGDKIVSMKVIDESSVLLTVLENGYGKRTTIVRHFKTQNRGGMGVRASKVTTKTGRVVEALVLGDDAGDVILVSVSGTVIRIKVKAVKMLGRDTQGVRLMRLRKDDKVASVTRVVEDPQEAALKDETPSKELATKASPTDG